VHRLELLAIDADLVRLEIECSTGFYVRSLAHDIGRGLGCGAHLTMLRRTRSGSFTLEQAVPLDDIEHAGPSGAARIVPLEQSVDWLPEVRLTARGAERAAHGSQVSASEVIPDSSGKNPVWPPAATTPVRLLDERGGLVAIAEARHGLLHPVVVLG
jgi:tRNA pseudouridine55 synthase